MSETIEDLAAMLTPRERDLVALTATSAFCDFLKLVVANRGELHVPALLALAETLKRYEAVGSFQPEGHTDYIMTVLNAAKSGAAS